MSGRGVITSRTSVSPKSTIDSQQPAFVAFDQSFLLAGFEIGMRRIAGALVGRRRARFGGRLRLVALAAQRRDDPDQAARQRAQAIVSIVNDGSSAISTRSGS